jgi:glycosyltransferase involved in cell wall biosynthesis
MQTALQRILYISYDGMTDPLGQSQVLPYLVGLSAKGYQITILSCEKSERWHLKETIQSICSQHHLDWQPIMYTRKPAIVSTLNDVRALKQKAAALHKVRPFQLVHCRSYIASLVGQWMKKKYAVPFVFDMRGFWADERVDGGLWPTQKWLYKTIYQYFKRKEIQFLQEAAAVVALTYAAEATIEEWGVAHAPIHVIPCCVDTQLFAPEAIKQEQMAILRRKADLPNNKLVIGYVGSLGTWYLLDEMLQFYKFWLLNHPQSVLFFVSNEPRPIIYEALRQHNIDIDAVRLIAANRHEMPYYIAMMDLGLFFIKQAYSKKASSPVKQGELMAMGVPVICNAGVGDSDMIITKYQSGTLVHQFNREGFAAAIAALKEGLAHPSAIRQGCIDYFDLQKGIEAYDVVYRSVLN